MNNATQQTHAIFAKAARTAWAELASESAIATYKEKATEDIELTFDAIHFVAHLSYTLGIVARQVADQFVFDSLNPAKLLAAAVESVDGEIIDSQVKPLMLPPALVNARTASQSQANAYVEFCLGLSAWTEVMKTSMTVKQLREQLNKRGITAPAKTRKHDLVKLLVGS